MKNLFIDLRYFWLDSWFEIKSRSVKTKWLVWDRGIKNLLRNLWVSKDKFCGPLNWNSNAMLSMSHKQRIKYTMDFHERRRIAHEKDLANA